MDDVRQAAGQDTVTLARAAAEAIRGLNHATRHPAGLAQPAVAYDILAALSLAASRLPQLLGQITAWLDQALAAGCPGHDLGQDPARAIAAAGIFLGDARGSAAALDAAWQQLSLINGHPAPHPGKDRS